MPTDMEMSRTGLHFAPLKPRRNKPNMTIDITSTYLGGTLVGTPQDERAEAQGAQ